MKGLKAPERKWWSTELLQSDFLLPTGPQPQVRVPWLGACGPLPEGRAGRLVLGVPVGGEESLVPKFRHGVRWQGAAGAGMGKDEWAGNAGFPLSS